MGNEAKNGNDNLGAVYEILIQGATDKQTTNWSIQYGIHNTVGREKSGDGSTEAALQDRECTYLVETKTMVIKWRECTCKSGPSVCPQTSFITGLAKLDAALKGN